MRRLNYKELKDWLDRRGGSALAELSIITGLSTHTLARMRSGRYENAPSVTTQRVLCDALKLDLDTLFPVVDEEAS